MAAGEALEGRERELAAVERRLGEEEYKLKAREAELQVFGFVDFPVAMRQSSQGCHNLATLCCYNIS